MSNTIFALFHNSCLCSTQNTSDLFAAVHLLIKLLLFNLLFDRLLIFFQCDTSWSDWFDQDRAFKCTSRTLLLSSEFFLVENISATSNRARKKKSWKQKPRRTGALKWLNRTILSWTCLYDCWGSISLAGDFTMLPCRRIIRKTEC